MVESIFLCMFSNLSKSNPKTCFNLILTNFLCSNARCFLYNAFQGDAQRAGFQCVKVLNQIAQPKRFLYIKHTVSYIGSDLNRVKEARSRL